MKRLSRDEIRKMKENMQKTPLIQKQAEQYYEREGEGRLQNEIFKC